MKEKKKKKKLRLDGKQLHDFSIKSMCNFHVVRKGTIGMDEVKYISAMRSTRRTIKYLLWRDTKSKRQTLLTDETTKLTKFILH